MRETDFRSLLRALPALEGEFPAFQPRETPSDPVAMFRGWLLEALERDVSEPHAATLSTVDGSGLPDARVLVLKDVDESGWWFATGSESRKGRQLAGNPRAAMSFYWAAVGRQIRVRGSVRAAGASESAEDFRRRGTGGRAVALAGRQSEALATLEELHAAVDEARERLRSDPSLVAPTWTLFVLSAEEVEFWQAGRDREHVRLRYEREGARWRRTLLWP